VQEGAEYLMVNRALKAVRRSDVVLLMIDAIIGVSYQVDIH
jgi:predicted GTPase